MTNSMKKILPLLAAMAAGPAIAAPGGAIATLQLGSYVCELPGDVTGPAGQRVPAQDFTIINASSYATNSGRGSYLLTGKTVVMTSGPKRGQRFHKLSDSFLRLLQPDGAESTLRCIRQVTNNR